MGNTISQIPTFFINVFLHWQALVTGGVVTALFAGYQGLSGKQIDRKTYFWAFIVAASVCSCFLAWHDEHQNTQVVITEKARAIALANTCDSELRADKATIRGKEELVTALQSTITGLQTPQAQQQATINNCVLSLGKMNPLLRRKTSVVEIPVGLKDITSHRMVGKFALLKVYMKVLVIASNQDEFKPSGTLHCNNPFTIFESPQLPSRGPALTTSVPPRQMSDREYEIRVLNTSSDWGPLTPIYLTVGTATAETGGCSFNPS